MRAPELLSVARSWLRQHWPDALIIPEFPAAGGAYALIDVVALTKTELVGVEIKGDGDSTSRLSRQGFFYSNVATRVFLLPAPALYSKCAEKAPARWDVLKLTEEGGLLPPDERSGPLWNSPHALVDILWADETRQLARILHVEVMGLRGIALQSKIAETAPLEAVRREVLLMLRQRDWTRFNKAIDYPKLSEAA